MSPPEKSHIFDDFHLYSTLEQATDFLKPVVNLKNETRVTETATWDIGSLKKCQFLMTSCQTCHDWKTDAFLITFTFNAKNLCAQQTAENCEKWKNHKTTDWLLHLGFWFDSAQKPSELSWFSKLLFQIWMDETTHIEQRMKPGSNQAMKSKIIGKTWRGHGGWNIHFRVG